MRNRKKEQKAKDEIVRLKSNLKTIEAKLKSAYFDLYIAMGYSADTADRLVN